LSGKGKQPKKNLTIFGEEKVWNGGKDEDVMNGGLRNGRILKSTLEYHI